MFTNDRLLTPTLNNPLYFGDVKFTSFLQRSSVLSIGQLL